MFDLNGNFLTRAVTGGLLNAPWGVALAPAGFGIYAGDLLIGNFGDGLITAYNPTTYAYLGRLADSTGTAIAYPGLWEIFSNSNGNASALYFVAGLAKETHGLYGSIANVTTSTSTPTFNLSGSTTVATVKAGGSAQVTLSVAPSNSYAGTVSFTCSGLPVGATCSFLNPQVTVTATAPATTTVTILTANKTSSLMHPALNHWNASGIVAAVLLPFGSIFLARRRKQSAGLRTLAMLGILLGSLGVLAGCSSTPSSVVTPTGTSNVVVTATAGSLTRTTTVVLTVQ